MTKRFLKAVKYTFEHEGGYNHIKEDRGGATNFGMSFNLLKLLKLDVNKDGVVDINDIKELTMEQAEDIYYNNFWRPAYEVFHEKVGIKVFDVAVNAGHKRAHILLQRALNKLGERVVEDGMLGRETIGTVSKYTEAQVLEKYCEVQADFYNDIVKRNPSQRKFINGWLNRAAWKPK